MSHSRLIGCVAPVLLPAPATRCPAADDVRSLVRKEIGVEVEPTGTEAPRGEPKTANPIDTVRWARGGEPALETTEFSKAYSDASNPEREFAALMVCGEDDAACPLVIGASLRASMPYLDPKIDDDGKFEAAKYAERRDDVGRLMLSLRMPVQNRQARR